MAAEEGKDKKSSIKPITDGQRFKYIGFEVFPGKVKDLFRSDAEREKLVGSVRKKREEGETLRDSCTLMEERVSMIDRLVLTVASVIIFATLFIPWYSVYNEIVEEAPVPVFSEQEAAPTDSAMLAAEGDSTMLTAEGDSALAAVVDEVVDSSALVASVDSAAGDGGPEKTIASESAAEEVISGYVAKKKIHKEYERLSGVGSFVTLGSVGSYVFSSGGVLIISAIIFLIYALLCIGLPAYTLYGIYGLRGDPDQRALKLKKMLRYNWIPLIMFVLVLILSFFGADYGFNAKEMFTSLGNSYGPAAFLGTLSWGILLSLCAFILTAVKGVEI